jgi:hypothetical protein
VNARTINRKPGIPQIPPGLPQETARVLVALKEHVEVAQGVRGEYRDRYVTIGMLVSLGIITEQQARQLG